ncbi:hypothetical protein Agub_g8287, partial [Astrephomene gubernaculifera]
AEKARRLRSTSPSFRLRPSSRTAQREKAEAEEEEEEEDGEEEVCSKFRPGVGDGDGGDIVAALSSPRQSPKSLPAPKSPDRRHLSRPSSTTSGGASAGSRRRPHRAMPLTEPLRGTASRCRTFH